MTASDVGYDRIHAWVKPILGPVPATAMVTVAWAMLCLWAGGRSQAYHARLRADMVGIGGDKR